MTDFFNETPEAFLEMPELVAELDGKESDSDAESVATDAGDAFDFISWLYPGCLQF